MYTNTTAVLNTEKTSEKGGYGFPLKRKPKEHFIGLTKAIKKMPLCARFEGKLSHSNGPPAENINFGSLLVVVEANVIYLVPKVSEVINNSWQRVLLHHWSYNMQHFHAKSQRLWVHLPERPSLSHVPHKDARL